MKNKKGFTLVEMLVVVLVIGILAAIAMPSYRASVEKSRAAQGITSLTQIAKAQKTYSFKRGNYAEEMLSLPVDITDANGANATGSEYSDLYFDYKIFGDEFGRARATRNTGEYELSIDYGTGEIFCRPIDNKVCASLGFAEGEELITWPQQTGCDPTVYNKSFTDAQGYNCIRTIFKDGTIQDTVCRYTNVLCYVYNNEGIRIQQFFPGKNVYNYDPKTGDYEWIYYNSNGDLTSYAKFNKDGVRLQNISANSNSTILSIYDDDTEKTYYSLYYGKTSDTDRIDRYENGKRIYSQYYNSERQLSSVRYYSASGVEAYFTYNPDGTIKSSSCSSGACEGWKPPEMSSFQYQSIPDAPKVESCLETYADNPMVCGF